MPSTKLKDGGKAMKKVLPVLKKLSSNGELEKHTHINKIGRTFNKTGKRLNKGWYILDKLDDFTTCLSIDLTGYYSLE